MNWVSLDWIKRFFPLINVELITIQATESSLMKLKSFAISLLAFYNLFFKCTWHLQFGASTMGPMNGGNSLNNNPSLAASKPRLRWIHELHERFLHAVAQLGSPDSCYLRSVLISVGKQ